MITAFTRALKNLIPGGRKTPIVHLDHIVIGVPDLQWGIDHFKREYGIDAVIGGRHVGAGTWNALAPLAYGDGLAYVEIVARDPQQERVPLTLFGALDALASGEWCVLNICFRRDGLEGARAGDKVSDNLNPVQPGSRTRPTGEKITWKLATPTLDALKQHNLPFFIAWDDLALHPSRQSVQGPPLRIAGSVKVHVPDVAASQIVFENEGLSASGVFEFVRGETGRAAYMSAQFERVGKAV